MSYTQYSKFPKANNYVSHNFYLKQKVNCQSIHAKSLKLCSALCSPLTVACQTLLFMGFSKQETWSRLQRSPGNLPNPGTKPMPCKYPT